MSEGILELARPVAIELVSAVQTVHGTSGQTGELGATYSMERELPTGRVENGLEIFARQHPSEFGIRTTRGPTPFVYHYRFVPVESATVVHLDATSSSAGYRSRARVA